MGRRNPLSPSGGLLSTQPPIINWNLILPALIAQLEQNTAERLYPMAQGDGQVTPPIPTTAIHALVYDALRRNGGETFDALVFVDRSIDLQLDLQFHGQTITWHITLPGHVDSGTVEGEKHPFISQLVKRLQTYRATSRARFEGSRETREALIV